MKSVWEFLWSYRTTDLPRISNIWKDIRNIQNEIKELETLLEKETNQWAIYEYRERVINQKSLLIRLERELSEYRPEDVERGKKVA